MFILPLHPQAAVNGNTATGDSLSENDSGVELTNENSPLTAGEPPSPFSPKLNGDAASPQGNKHDLCFFFRSETFSLDSLLMVMGKII